MTRLPEPAAGRPIRIDITALCCWDTVGSLGVSVRDGVDVLFRVAGPEAAPAVLLAALLKAAGERAQLDYARDLVFVRIEIGAALDAELAPLDITAAQFAVLKSIAHEEAGSASGLCKDISYDPGAMTRMLDRLERRGLVRRVAHPSDRRASKLELTAEGKAVYPKLRASAMKVLNRLLSGFTQKEARQLERLLQRMLENA